MSATINLEKKHFPVLLDELISILSPLYGGTFIDCTFGQGHYSKKILEFKENKIIALDRDKDVYPNSKLLKEKFKNRFQFYNIKFSQIENINLDTNYLKGIVFDLGYSTIQINDPKKGLSFKKKEGDNKTPKGIFRLENLYYRKDRVKKPQTALNCVKINNDMGWCNDINYPTKYNKHEIQFIC